MKKRKNAAAVALRQIGMKKTTKASRKKWAQDAARTRWDREKAKQSADHGTEANAPAA